MDKKALTKNKNFLLSPQGIGLGLFSGLLIGVFWKDFAFKISILGDIFLAFLMMCTLPIVITAVIGGLGRMFHSPDMSKEVKKLCMLFLFSLFFCAGTSYIVTVYISPGNSLSKRDKETLGKRILEQEKIMDSIEKNKDETFGVLKKIIPSNVFEAMSRGHIMGVLFFSVFLGISIGLLRSGTSAGILNIMDAIFNACQQIISWGMYLLPFALCSFVADQVAKVGFRLLFAIGSFIFAAYISALVVIIINGFIMARATGVSYSYGFKAIREALVIAFCTSNTLPAIPSALRGLQEELRLNQDKTNLIVPFGITMCNPSAIIYFVVVSVFFCDLNDVSPVLDNSWIIIIFGSIFASFGTAGGGAAIYGLLPIVFDPLGLSAKSALPILLAIDRFICPILATADVHMNCTIATIMAQRKPYGSKTEHRWTSSKGDISLEETQRVSSS